MIYHHLITAKRIKMKTDTVQQQLKEILGNSKENIYFSITTIIKETRTTESP